MAGRALTSFLLTATILAALLATCHAGGIAIYWGQNDGEASLSTTCASSNYKFVILAFVYKFGKGQTPQLDLSSHCDPSSGGCKALSEDILLCQRRGIKVHALHRRRRRQLRPVVPGRRQAGRRLPLE